MSDTPSSKKKFLKRMPSKYTLHCLKIPKWGMIVIMATILLALGTNLGQRLQNLQKAQSQLAQIITLKSISPIYETEPWGVEAQPFFLNQTVLAETDLPPQELLTLVKDIETRMGRDFSEVRYGPRIIDIDILGYDDLRLSSPDLTIPHPLLHERAFVLVPLNDIAPDWIHPVLGLTVAEMLARVDVSGVRRWQGTNTFHNNEHSL